MCDTVISADLSTCQQRALTCLKETLETFYFEFIISYIGNIVLFLASQRTSPF